jgi:alpha-glucosidase
MHLEKSTWGAGAKHGANTSNVKRTIDFAAKQGFQGVLVEGWNQGWDGNWVGAESNFSFTKPYPDFDLPGLSAYAKEKGVSLIGHHETGGHIANYEAQMDAGYQLYASLGINSIKSGYVTDGGTAIFPSANGQIILAIPIHRKARAII